MLEKFSGATRLYPVVGDPIAQVKSPYGVTETFEARGVDAVCVPMQVGAENFPAFMGVMRDMKNCDGVIITIPHKFAAAEQCDALSERSTFLRSVNTIRRTTGGRFEGDMFDGLGFVSACRRNGCDFKGRRALLIGAGGAGTAIAHAIASAGVSQLGIVDTDTARRDDLVGRLQKAGLPAIAATANDVANYQIACNATPLGMRAGDPLPFAVDALPDGAFVGDVVTKPEISPVVAAARARGLKTSTGVDMFVEVRTLMIDFLLQGR